MLRPTSEDHRWSCFFPQGHFLTEEKVSLSLFFFFFFFYIHFHLLKWVNFENINIFFSIKCGYFPFLFPLNVLLVVLTLLWRKKKGKKKKQKKNKIYNWLIVFIFDLILNCFHTFWLLRPKRMEILGFFFWVNLF